MKEAKWITHLDRRQLAWKWKLQYRRQPAWKWKLQGVELYQLRSWLRLCWTAGSLYTIWADLFLLSAARSVGNILWFRLWSVFCYTCSFIFSMMWKELWMISLPFLQKICKDFLLHLNVFSNISCRLPWRREDGNIIYRETYFHVKNIITILLNAWIVAYLPEQNLLSFNRYY